MTDENDLLRPQDEIDWMMSMHREPETYEEGLTSTEVDSLIRFYREEELMDRCKETNYGNIFKFSYYKEDRIFGIIENAVNKLIGTGWKFESGRFHEQKTNRWTRIHTDTAAYAPLGLKNMAGLQAWIKEGNNKDLVYIPWRTFLFPLEFAETHGASTILFNQRYYGIESIRWKDYGVNGKYIGEVLNYKEGYNIDDDIYEKYLKHCTKERLQGLTVHSCYDWKVGGCFEVDSNQIHLGGYLSNPPKMCFIVRVSYVENKNENEVEI
jgi:hypothetical protein